MALKPENPFSSGTFNMIFALALVMRLFGLRAGLEYDEIWTCHLKFDTFSSVFTALSVPNNHPLNTILTQLVFASGLPPWTIRLLPLAAGLGAVLLAYLAVRRFFRSKSVGMCAALAVAMSPCAILYSVSARGYSLQLFLVLLFAYLLQKGDDADEGTWLYSAAAAAGIFAFLTIPTSILFIFPVSLVHYAALFINKAGTHRKIRSTAAYSLLGASALWYYMTALPGLLAAQNRFGVTPESAEGFFRFAMRSLSGVCGTATIIMFVFALCAVFFVMKKRRAKMLVLTFLMLFPPAAALVFREGPPRTYLPLLIFAAAGAGLGIAMLPLVVRRRGLTATTVAVIALLVTGAGYRETSAQWERTDWKRRAEAILKTPETDIPVSLPTESLPMFFNGENLKDGKLSVLALKRMESLNEKSRLLLFDSEKIVASDTEKEISFIAKTEKVPFGRHSGVNAATLLPATDENLKTHRLLLIAEYGMMRPVIPSCLSKAGTLNVFASSFLRESSGVTKVFLIVAEAEDGVSTDVIRGGLPYTHKMFIIRTK